MAPSLPPFLALHHKCRKSSLKAKKALFSILYHEAQHIHGTVQYQRNMVDQHKLNITMHFVKIIAYLLKL